MAVAATDDRGGRVGPSATPLLDAAEAAGWLITPTRRVLLDDLHTALAVRRRPRVAVVGEAPRPVEPGGLRRVLASWPRVRLSLFEGDLDPSRLHAGLAAHGPFDLLVLDCASDGPALDRFSDVFFHARRGGTVAVRFPAGGRGAEDVAARRWTHLQRFLEHLRGSGSVDAPRSALGREEQAEVVRDRLLYDRRLLSEAIGRLVVEPHHLVAVNRKPALAKLREHEMDLVLALRSGSSGRVLERLPGTAFRSRCELRESSQRTVSVLYRDYDAPAASLREYTDVTCAPQQVAAQGNLLLPDTFRKPLAPRLLNIRVEEAGERFARRLDDQRPTGLSGTYFYLDTEFPGHFGHALTEQLSRLWALPAARRSHPDLKVIVSRRPARPGLVAFERELFAAAGVPEGDVVLVHSPVRVERLLAATPLFSTPDYVHPDVELVWTAVGDALVSSAPDRVYPRRVFCSRRVRRRPCHNAADVEALFQAHGFAVVYPEDLPFAEQSRMFREADVVAGFAGSQLFTLVFSRSPKHVIVLSSESYTASNEYLVCSVLGHRLDMVWSVPDVDHPEMGWDQEAFRSGFTFDFQREGEYLREVLASLDGHPASPSP